MSVVTIISRKLLGIFLGIMALFKRAMCFLGRRRRNSGTLLPTTNHYPVDSMSANITQSVPGNEEGVLHVAMDGGAAVPPQVEMESWDNWGQGEAPVNISVVDNGVPGYQSNRRKSTETPEEEPAVDFFTDMTPRFKKPKTVFVGSSPKLLIRKKDEQTGPMSSRLAMASASEIPQQMPELGSWEETENAWDEAVGEDLSWEAEATIKEKRRQDRELRQVEHQKKKLERDSQRLVKKDSNSHMSAVKLS